MSYLLSVPLTPLNPYTLKGVSLTAATDQRMWGIDALNEPQ